MRGSAPPRERRYAATSACLPRSASETALRLRGAIGFRRNGDSSGRVERLTEREIEVLRLLAGGLTNRQIATALHTAEGTVKNQVSSILAKVGVQDRMLAVLEAIEAGWI